jgi:hypothetical protein
MMWLGSAQQLLKLGTALRSLKKTSLPVAKAR